MPKEWKGLIALVNIVFPFGHHLGNYAAELVNLISWYQQFKLKSRYLIFSFDSFSLYTHSSCFFWFQNTVICSSLNDYLKYEVQILSAWAMSCSTSINYAQVLCKQMDWYKRNAISCGLLFWNNENCWSTSATLFWRRWRLTKIDVSMIQL